MISFLEVNTRLQVEHPVSEETSGLDLVREQFRIAEGEVLNLLDDPEPRGHSARFGINGEDAGCGTLPAPGTVSAITFPSGPGVRVDAGVEAGSVIGGRIRLAAGQADRHEVGPPAGAATGPRALAEFQVEGMATVLPFHRLVVEDPAFASHEFTVHTRWIETEWDNTVAPFAGAVEAEEEAPRQSVVVEVGGRRLEVSLPGDLALGGSGPAPARARKATRKRHGKGAPKTSGDAVTAPMQGHGHQGRGERRRGLHGRPGRRARGDEDGEPRHRAQERHDQEPGRRAGQSGRPGRGALRDQGLSRSDGVAADVLMRGWLDTDG